MINLPRLAIVGRPNVGKSALFNRIAGRRLAIVDESEGVTRDRLYALCLWFRFPFEVIDTGGIDPSSTDPFGAEIRKQAEKAVEESDTIVMVVDGSVGLSPLEERLARWLLKTGKPVCLAVNKIDTPDRAQDLYRFLSLGIKEIIPISALHSLNIDGMLEKAWEGKTYPDMPPAPTSPLKVSVVGRPNVGKSTLINALLGDERCIVSPTPGTTRDIVEVPFKLGDKNYILLDTAGITRKKGAKDNVDTFMQIRTETAISQADLCLLVLNVQEGVTVQEKKIINAIEKEGKGCILLLNKWDLVEGFRMEHCLKALHKMNPFLAHCPTLVISAKQKRNIDKLFPVIDQVSDALDHRITTHQLNKFLERAMQLCHPPMISGKRLRIYYLTQVSTRPPRFVLFVNYPELLTGAYKKYLLNKFRENYPFPGVPLEFHLKGKKVILQDWQVE